MDEESGGHHGIRATDFRNTDAVDRREILIALATVVRTNIVIVHNEVCNNFFYAGHIGHRTDGVHDTDLDELDLTDILVDTGRFDGETRGKGIHIEIPILALETEEAADGLFLGIFVERGRNSLLGKADGIHELIGIRGALGSLRKGELVVDGIEIGTGRSDNGVAGIVETPYSRVPKSLFVLGEICLA
jgi:hypothetical protein